MLFPVRVGFMILVMCVMTQLPASSQPFLVPSPNIPPNATGINPTLGIAFGDVEWGDFNADSHLDFIITGKIAEVAGGFLPLFGAIYRNTRVDFNGLPPPPPRFDFVRFSVIEPVWLSATAWEDYDGDGDLDLVLLGARDVEPPYDPLTVIYENAGNGVNFDEVLFLPGLHSGAIDWGDYDNDGDADIVISGVLESGVPLTILVENEDPGFDSFVPPITGVGYGDAQFVDVDGDFDLDLSIAGATESGTFVTEIYRNDGGNFTLIPQDLPGRAFATLDWGDYDADGDPDLILSGGSFGPLSVEGETLIFNNDGTGQLSVVDLELTSTYYGDTNWIDYDRDGDLDALTTGVVHPFSSPRTEVQINNGGTFSTVNVRTAGLGAAPVVGLKHGMHSWGDFDENNATDLLISGLTKDDSLFTALYTNLGRQNIRPSAPFGMLSTVVGSEVTFSWSATSDTETPSNALTYNLRVGTSPGADDIVASNALSDGKRLVVRPGNVGSNTGWRLSGLPPGTYYWNVQSIDTDMTGSSFSIEQSFTIN